MFVILLFGSGMPVLYPIGVFYYSVTYIVNKTLILNFFKRTRTMNRTIPTYTMQLLMLGLVVHMIGAAFMLTNPHPFKTESESEVLAHFNAVKDIDQVKKMYEQEKDSDVGGVFFSRFKYLHQQIFIIFIFVFALFALAGETLISLLTVIYDQLVRCIYHTKREATKQAEKVMMMALPKTKDTNMTKPQDGQFSDSDFDMDTDELYEQINDNKKQIAQLDYDIKDLEKEQRNELELEAQEKYEQEQLELQNQNMDQSDQSHSLSSPDRPYEEEYMMSGMGTQA